MYTYKRGEGVEHPLFLFITERKFTFSVRFENFPYTIKDIGELRSIGVDCDNGNNPPHDYRVGQTICAIINEYLLQNPHEIITYVCEDNDNRAKVRQQTFVRWGDQYNSERHKMITQDINTPNGTYYTSLIFDPVVYNQEDLIAKYRDELTKMEEHKY